MKIFEMIKNGYKNYISKLAENNKKEFGKGSLDCCELNKKGK